MFAFLRQPLVLALATIAGLTGYAAKPAVADSAVYERVLQSSVYIYNGAEKTRGSGFVVDADRQLIVTNYHVVGEAKQVAIFFAAYDGDGELVTDKDVYYDNFKMLCDQKMACVAKVVGVWPEKDLALVELDGCPVDVTALPLADQGAKPGQTVHSVGSPGASDALWVYSPGTVRQVFNIKMNYEGGQRVDAKVLQTTSPINPGDSGGPIVNDRGELVGVNCAGEPGARLISFAIEVDELRSFLNKYLGTAADQQPTPEPGYLVGWPQ